MYKTSYSDGWRYRNKHMYMIWHAINPLQISILGFAEPPCIFIKLGLMSLINSFFTVLRAKNQVIIQLGVCHVIYRITMMNERRCRMMLR